MSKVSAISATEGQIVQKMRELISRRQSELGMWDMNVSFAYEKFVLFVVQTIGQRWLKRSSSSRIVESMPILPEIAVNGKNKVKTAQSSPKEIR